MTAFLDRVPDTRVLGIVANDLSELDSATYGYGGGYGYGGYGGEGPGSSKRRRRRSTKEARPAQAASAEHV
jgi:hypothetical protein